jgi:hypothetical protein
MPWRLPLDMNFWMLCRVVTLEILFRLSICPLIRPTLIYTRGSKTCHLSLHTVHCLYIYIYIYIYETVVMLDDWNRRMSSSSSSSKRERERVHSIHRSRRQAQDVDALSSFSLSNLHENVDFKEAKDTCLSSTTAQPNIRRRCTRLLPQKRGILP